MLKHQINLKNDNLYNGLILLNNLTEINFNFYHMKNNCRNNIRLVH